MASGMHVCVVVESHVAARMGGAEYQSHLLADELCQRAGVRVTYVARNVQESDTVGYAIRKVGDASGIRRRAVLFDARVLRQTLATLKPDVIYQRMKQSYTAVCASHARRAGIPLVFHAASDPDVDGRWLRRGLTSNFPLDLLEDLLGNRGLRMATHVVVQTERQSELLQRKFGIRRAALIRNFQPLPEHLPQKENSRTRILWVGNLKEVKRPELFLSLANKLANNNDLEFWMVGREANHRSFRSTMSDIRSSPHVRYFGELPLDEVNSLMCRADIFVNTSLYEGSPNTFIQAWARGAVVTSLGVDIDGGMASMGIGFVTHDIDALSKIIQELSSRPELRKQTSHRAFCHVHREHSLKNASRLADLVLTAAEDFRRYGPRRDS